MKTKYATSFIAAGFLLAIAMGSALGNESDLTQIVVNWVFLVLGVASVGYGFKLKMLAKKGVKETN